MPHLIYGGRLWRLASDELSLPASCAASSRVLWSVMLAIIIALTAQSIEECSGQGYYILGYLVGSLCLQAINILCEVCIIRHSIKGSMVDSKPRAEVTSYLTLHLVLSMLQLVCAIYGVLVINMDFIPCNSVISENGMTFLLYIVIISQLVDISGFLCCATMFSSRTVDVALHMDENDMSPHSAHSRTSRTSRTSTSDHVDHPDLGLVGPTGEDLLQWEKRCGSLCRRLQLLTCNLFGGAGVGDDMATVGRVFSNFFHHEGFLDVVPSDVVAGFLLVRLQQKMKKIQNREARITMISQQGIEFDRKPAKYGTRTTAVLEVPKYGVTPRLEDAQNIVTAAKEGVVLRPPKAPVPKIVEMSPATSVSVDVSTVRDEKSTKSFQGDEPRGLSPSPSQKSLSSRRQPAAPSRYSPRTIQRSGSSNGRLDKLDNAPTWNSSEMPDVSPPAFSKFSNPPPLLPAGHNSPITTSFKTRKSYFSALEVLEKNSSASPSQSAPTSPRIIEEDDENGEINDFDYHQTIGYTELSDVTRFSYFALAAYSTLMFLYMYPCSGCCKLCTYGCCHESALKACCGSDSSTPRSQSSNPGLKSRVGHVSKMVEFDNRCHTHESAMRQMVKAPNTELIYAQFSNDIETRPYAVFIDYEKEALVITVRGTLSLEDCVTDAMSEPEPLDDVGKQYGFNGVGRFAHSGFLKSAQWICEDLRKHPHVAKLLDAVAGTAPVGMSMDRNSSGSMDASGTLDTPLKPRVFSRLAVVGHSLGAGVASLLALLLKKEFPTLHCYGYGAPGSTMDEETAHEVKSFVTSVVLGDDMVGSLSFHSLSVLREDVLDAIVRSRCSKMSILQTIMFKECNESVLEELLYEPGEEPTSTFRTMFLDYKSYMKRQRASFVPCQLHIPGKVIHLRQIGKEKDRSSIMGSISRVFVPVIEPDLDYFHEIKVSATMITDHLPDLYVTELNAMLHDWAIERHAQHHNYTQHDDAERKDQSFNELNDNQV